MMKVGGRHPLRVPIIYGVVEMKMIVTMVGMRARGSGG